MGGLDGGGCEAGKRQQSKGENSVRIGRVGRTGGRGESDWVAAIDTSVHRRSADNTGDDIDVFGAKIVHRQSVNTKVLCRGVLVLYPLPRNNLKFEFHKAITGKEHF